MRLPLKPEEEIATLSYQLQNVDTRPAASMWAVDRDLSAKIDTAFSKLISGAARRLPELNRMAGQIRLPVIHTDSKTR